MPEYRFDSTEMMWPLGVSSSRSVRIIVAKFCRSRPEDICRGGDKRISRCYIRRGRREIIAITPAAARELMLWWTGAEIAVRRRERPKLGRPVSAKDGKPRSKTPAAGRGVIHSGASAEKAAASQRRIA
jgi:hypothetical protein